ncbi:putative sugar nucleotidyltransferase [Archaeoglobus sulfaticallidus PM70-1]|uniref:Putative sugar nucleotidyltransferase n=1 Tax=Archaeoglobus sulfaticallidus PM70-1 TaxID=387631 RepID=N0BF25_9EURY|nr:phosphocholine cytidylyltransferase family protein [Archaeoglobus sulfaticallidus]AGK60877.1 putative sugar nucleotidyltransferase [Archaeoglobus sulfaticallidus PM70-1]
MEVVILAAGLGSRLGHITSTKPKSLLRIGDKTLIRRIINTIRKYGIMDVVVVTGYKDRMIREHLRNAYNMNIEFVHNADYDITNNIYSLYLSKDALSGGDFYIINSDVLFHEKIFSILHTSKKNGLILAVDVVKKLNRESMKVVLINNRVLWISKKIPTDKANGEYIGLAKVGSKEFKSLFRSLRQVMEIHGYNEFYESAFQHMIDNGRPVTYESTRGLPWIEIDTIEDLRLANEQIYPKILRTRYY